MRASFHHADPVTDPDEGDETIGYVESDFEIVQCGGCGMPSFRMFWYASNTPPEYFKLPGDRARLYPARLPDRPRLRGVTLPSQIEAIYGETHEALSNRSRILVVMGMRAILERRRSGWSRTAWRRPRR